MTSSPIPACDGSPIAGAPARDIEARIRQLSELASRLGDTGIVAEAAALAGRVREGRFFVACLGQFKRGKSTLLNTLVGHAVLPVGVPPVTAAVTILRYGERLSARVRGSDGAWTDIAIESLGAYVSEEENPENAKGISAVEVLVPSPLLSSGLCLVDTPGIGSVFQGNTRVTEDFLPQIDAALVVFGADPPLSGEELRLIRDATTHVRKLILVLNKADRLDDVDRSQARRFAERILVERAGVPNPRILEVSALERERVGKATRDWSALESALTDLAATSGRVLVRGAGRRGLRRLGALLLREVDERRSALVRPVDDVARRADDLARAVAEAERLLRENAYLFSAVQDELARTFEVKRNDLLAGAFPVAAAELDRILTFLSSERRGKLRASGLRAARDVAEQRIEGWRDEMTPLANDLYRTSMSRFAELANGLVRPLADPEDPLLAALPTFEPPAGLAAEARFYFHEQYEDSSGGVSAAREFADTRERIEARVREEARAYLRRLLEANSTLAANDFRDQVVESRRRLEGALRMHLNSVADIARRALEQARRLHSEGASAVEAAIRELDGARDELSALILAEVGGNEDQPR
ncbi:MAG TPA: dynamin family protein [Polyangiaceae bacterium]|nr:dynamin family protein [Polyangiaceae bacterium]